MSFKLQNIRDKIEKFFFLDIRSKNDHNYKKAYKELQRKQFSPFQFADEKHLKNIKVAVEEEEEES